MNPEDYEVLYHECPSCGAKQDELCTTPKGTKKKNVHDTRQYSLVRKQTKG